MNKNFKYLGTKISKIWEQKSRNKNLGTKIWEQKSRNKNLRTKIQEQKSGNKIREQNP
jgi:cell division protein FtsL